MQGTEEKTAGIDSSFTCRAVSSLNCSFDFSAKLIKKRGVYMEGKQEKGKILSLPGEAEISILPMGLNSERWFRWVEEASETPFTGLEGRFSGAFPGKEMERSG